MGEAGLIRITAPISIGDAFLPEFTGDMRKRLPQITFDSDLSNETRDFDKDEIDFALRTMEVEEPELIARYLGRLRDSIVCTPAMAKALKLKHPSQLSEQECILTSTETRWNVWNLISAKEEIQIQVSGKISTSQYLSAKQFALKGYGITRLPTHSISSELKSGLLVELFPNYEVTTHPLYLVYSKNVSQSHSHQIVRDWLLKWFKNKPEFFANVNRK
ncbi:MAG: hypothetical protein H7333_01630 [Bdellovibrionales bacterium]|nr:hypothetical protein [Oligoflexia bacterium]